jgi:hypothetical protein
MTFQVHRTYPQPDSPAVHLGPRERALAVFKYLQDLEPEAAIKHPLFKCIEHAFAQAERKGSDPDGLTLKPSVVPELSGPVPAKVAPLDLEARMKGELTGQ